MAEHGDSSVDDDAADPKPAEDDNRLERGDGDEDALNRFHELLPSG